MRPGEHVQIQHGTNFRAWCRESPNLSESVAVACCSKFWLNHMKFVTSYSFVLIKFMKRGKNGCLNAANWKVHWCPIKFRPTLPAWYSRSYLNIILAAVRASCWRILLAWAPSSSCHKHCKKTAKLKIARFLRNKACGKCCRKMRLVLQRPSALSYFGLECSLTAKWKHPQNQLTVFLSWGFSAVQTCSQRFVNHGHQAIGVYSGLLTVYFSWLAFRGSPLRGSTDDTSTIIPTCW